MFVLACVRACVRVRVSSPEVDGAQERVADTQVAVDGDGDHDQSGEGDVGRDKEVVGLAEEVVPQTEAAVLHVHGVGNDDETGDEIDESEGEDEDRGDELVFLAPEHVQHDTVAGRADEAEGGEHGHHDVQLDPALPYLVRLEAVAAARARVTRHLPGPGETTSLAERDDVNGRERRRHGPRETTSRVERDDVTGRERRRQRS